MNAIDGLKDAHRHAALLAGSYLTLAQVTLDKGEYEEAAKNAAAAARFAARAAGLDDTLKLVGEE